MLWHATESSPMFIEPFYIHYNICYKINLQNLVNLFIFTIIIIITITIIFVSIHKLYVTMWLLSSIRSIQLLAIFHHIYILTFVCPSVRQ